MSTNKQLFFVLRNPFATFGAGVLLVTALLCSGCRFEESDRTDDGRVIVTYWEKWTGFEGEAMQAVVDDFNASQDRIFVEKLTVSEISRKMLLATAGGNPPDVAGLWSFMVPVYAERGALTPLNRYAEEAGLSREDYTPVYWDLCHHKGFLWALPSTPASVALHWNKKMFREAGLDPERPPRSIAELDAMAEQLTIVEVVRDGEPVEVTYNKLTAAEKEAKEFTLVQMGYSPSEPGWWNAMWGYWFGASLWDRESKITAASPENIQAFEWFRSYPEKYGLANMQTFGASFGNFASPQNAFLAGQVAMVLQGVWMYNFIDKYAPELEWAAAPFPSNDPEEYPLVTLTECDVLLIPRGAKHTDEAFEFIRYVNSQRAMEKLNMGQRKYSPLSNVSQAFIDQHPNPYIKTFIDLAKSPHARHAPKLSIFTEYQDEMVVAANQIFTLIDEPEEALGNVERRLQRRLDRALRRWNMIRDDRIEEWSAE